MMNSTSASPEGDLPPVRDGFDMLDECHRQSLFALGRLAALITRLGRHGADAEARVLANEVVVHFSTTARQHHEDEEQHVFPKLLATGDADTVQAVLRLREDHHWIEENWMELSPHLDAVASGQSWYDMDILQQGTEVFSALLHDHMALEESFIYPSVRSRLRPGEGQDMGREMAARRRAERLRRES